MTSLEDIRWGDSIEPSVEEMNQAIREMADLFSTPPAWEVLGNVEAEMRSQDTRWGEQNHPLIGGTMPWVLRGKYEFHEREMQRANAARVNADTLGWDTILLEEVYEALCAKDPADQITELVQVAAVAVQAALAIKRAQ